MLDLVDLLLLRRGIPPDDCALNFRRVDGNAAARVLYFLPWHTPFGVARQAGLMPLEFLACYEMPAAIVSSEPDLCLRAMLALVTDGERLLAERGIAGEDALVVGLSVGSYPATYLANRIGARLCSVASADRADLAIWESPATRIVKHRALHKGYGLSHYSKALAGTDPAQNLAGLAPNSLFVVGRNDPFVPLARKNGLLRAIDAHAPKAHVVKPHAGHLKTLIMSSRFQRSLSGVRAVPNRWRWPYALTGRREMNGAPLAAGLE
jgi:pimeloyl-ACP methyl ester carboxylesterase